MKYFAHGVLQITFILSVLLFCLKVLLINSESAITKEQLKGITSERVKMFDKYDSFGGSALGLTLLFVVVFSTFLGIFGLIFPWSIGVLLFGGIVWFEALASLNTDVYRRYTESSTDRLFIYDKAGKLRWIANLLFWISSIMLALHLISLMVIWAKS
jgi:hypothetical protein